MVHIWDVCEQTTKQLKHAAHVIDHNQGSHENKTEALFC